MASYKDKENLMNNESTGTKKDLGILTGLFSDNERTEGQSWYGFYNHLVK